MFRYVLDLLDRGAETPKSPLPLESATASIVQNYCKDFVDFFFYYAHWRHDIAGCINTGENGTW
jgi:hypothetical protein